MDKERGPQSERQYSPKVVENTLNEMSIESLAAVGTTVEAQCVLRPTLASNLPPAIAVRLSKSTATTGARIDPKFVRPPADKLSP